MKTQTILNVAKIAALFVTGFAAYKIYKVAVNTVGGVDDKIDAIKKDIAETFKNAKNAISETVDKINGKVLHDGSPSPETRLGRNPEVDDGQDQAAVEDALEIDKINQSAAETARLKRLNDAAKKDFDNAVMADVEVYNPTSRYSDFGRSP